MNRPLTCSPVTCSTLSAASSRRGMTLIELLVVIFIVMTVTALAIPIVAPAMRGRQVREASRLVTAYLAGARSEALRTGRATGVIFERFPGVPEMCINLSRCQVPPAFTGMTTGEQITVNIAPDGTASINQITAASWLPPSNPLARVQPGDLIRFNYQGHIYRLDFNATNGWTIGRNPGTPNVWVMNSDTATQPVVITAPGVPYQVFRQPKRTSTPPVQLPAGIVIDLAFSGDDLGPFVFRQRPTADFPTTSNYKDDLFAGDATATTTLGVMIVFAPDGSVERLCRPGTANSQATIRPTGPIHLLIGRRERVPVTTVQTHAGLAALHSNAEEQIATYNFMDLENLWVTINPRSGQITSTEMFAVPTIANPATPVPGISGGTVYPLADRVRLSRQFALEGQAMGGP